MRDDFFCDETCPLDLVAKVYSSETEDIVGQYIIFCHVLNQQVRLYGPVETAAREAIRICKDRNVLKATLEDREKEVVNIMIMLFDQEYATKAYGRSQREEGRQEGVLSTLVGLFSEGIITVEDAAKRAGLTVSEFKSETAKLAYAGNAQ